MSEPHSHVSSSLDDRALICIVDGGWLTVFTENHFWKGSWAHAVISMTESCMFLCWAPWGLEDHGHLLLDWFFFFVFLFCFGGGFLQILGLFWYYLLCMMKYSKSLTFYIEEHFSEIVPPFVNIVCCSEMLFSFFYTVMLRTCSKSTICLKCLISLKYSSSCFLLVPPAVWCLPQLFSSFKHL